MNDLKSLGFVLFWSTSEECGHVAVTEERAKALFKRIPKKGDMVIEKILHGKNVLKTTCFALLWWVTQTLASQLCLID